MGKTIYISSYLITLNVAYQASYFLVTIYMVNHFYQLCYSKINTDDLHKEIKSIKSEMLSIVTVAPYLKIWLDKKQQRKDKRKKAKKGKKPKPHKDQKKEETHEEKIEVSATEDDLDME